MNELAYTSFMFNCLFALTSIFILWGTLRVFDSLCEFNFKNWLNNEASSYEKTIYISVRLFAFAYLFANIIRLPF